MVARRAMLVMGLLTVPPLLTLLAYFASKFVLQVTSRTIEPTYLVYAAAIELVVFFFVGILEIRDRW